MNDCQINESHKLFVMGSFQFRFVVTNSSSLSSCSCPLLFRFRKNKQAAISCELFSVVSSVLRDDNLIQLIGFDNVEQLQTLGFAGALHCFLGQMIIITGTSVYIFSFSC